ncbi:MAG: hypothetical protein Pg6A_08750 [Termitinemataceae bacterium]|nr:MAG: hypothetical protein Pg6A_08750 [Termitinemataceae bacterium]
MKKTDVYERLRDSLPLLKDSDVLPDNGPSLSGLNSLKRPLLYAAELIYVRRFLMKKGLFHKRIAGLAAALIAALFFVSCLSMGSSGGGARTERKVPGKTPQFVKDAVKNAPEDALVGIGTAKMATTSLSRTTAVTRGRAEISRQLQSAVKDMVLDYSAGSEVDPSATMSFTESITRALSRSDLQGARVVEEDIDDAGAYWCVVMLSKSDTIKEVNQAAAQAKLNAPKMAAFDAAKRMDEAFDKLNAQEMQVGNR